MRRWYFGVAVVLSLALVAGLSPFLWSGGQPKGNGVKADDPPVPKVASNKIVRFTVYPNSALVTREVELPPGQGLFELVVTPMPDQIVSSTMYSEGGDGIRVLTTRFRTRQVLEDTSEDRRKLEAEMEQLMVIGSKIDSEIDSIQKNMNLLSKLENFTEKSTILSTEKGAFNGDAVITMAKYVMEQRAEKAKEMVAVKEQIRRNRKKRTASSTRPSPMNRTLI